MKPQQFLDALQDKHIRLREQQIQQFDLYFNQLIDWNKKMNLTALTAKEDVYLKHFYDSLTPAFHYNFKPVKQICDIGSGAGFPSLPLKICFPHLQVTIVDSLKKRIDFLKHLCGALELENVLFYHERAENFGKDKQKRENFDVVTARAVARMSVLSELCLPLVKKDGLFIAMKGSQAEEEIQIGQTAIHLMGGEVDQIDTFSLPKEESDRTIVFVRKKGKTPQKYPRKAGTPGKSPIE